MEKRKMKFSMRKGYGCFKKTCNFVPSGKIFISSFTFPSMLCLPASLRSDVARKQSLATAIASDVWTLLPSLFHGNFSCQFFHSLSSWINIWGTLEDSCWRSQSLHQPGSLNHCMEQRIQAPPSPDGLYMSKPVLSHWYEEFICHST